MSRANEGVADWAARTLKPNLMAAANSAPISKPCRPIPLPAFETAAPASPQLGPISFGDAEDRLSRPCCPAWIPAETGDDHFESRPLAQQARLTPH